MIVLAVIICIIGLLGTIVFISVIEKNMSGGCLSIIFFLILIGGYIGGIVGVGIKFGAPGVAIFNLVGIILGIIGIRMPESESSSSMGSSMGAANWNEKRRNNPNTCDTCAEYSHTRGVCKIDDKPMSTGDKCSNWR